MHLTAAASYNFLTHTVRSLDGIVGAGAVALEYADRVSATRVDVPDDFFANLQRLFSEREIVELTAHSAHENHKSSRPPIPTSDTGTGRYNATERGMTLLRWIRKAVEALKDDAPPSIEQRRPLPLRQANYSLSPYASMFGSPDREFQDSFKHRILP
jgi:hypothetical protein